MKYINYDPKLSAPEIRLQVVHTLKVTHSHAPIKLF